MAATTLVSLDDYLHNSSYHPDVEYVDGELKERPVVFSVHGRLQSLISTWFGMHEDEWGVLVAVEVRTLVAPTRVRLPDVVIDHAGEWPQTLVKPPLIVIEILSPNDSYSETQRLAQDYVDMGIENIWLIDPETRTGRVCSNNIWTATSSFRVDGTSIYLDLTALFSRLDRYNKS